MGVKHFAINAEAAGIQWKLVLQPYRKTITLLLQLPFLALTEAHVALCFLLTEKDDRSSGWLNERGHLFSVEKLKHELL